MTEPTPDLRKQRRMLIVLALIFAAPFALSWLLFNYTSFGRGGATTNHGQLINPPRQLADMALHDLAHPDVPASLYGKWNLVYLVDGTCDTRCAQNLYRMRQVRLAQGKHAHRVQRVLLNLGTGSVTLDGRQLQEFAGQLITSPADRAALLQRFRLTAGDDPLAAGRLYIVDPRGFLMMSYEAGVDPVGIIDDLHHLLRFSGVG